MAPGPPTASDDSACASGPVSDTSASTMTFPGGGLAPEGTATTVVDAGVAAAAVTSGRPAAVALTERGTPT